ncbi:MAG: gamma-glutamylcyclotransferase [Rhodobacteraceae bacterium]|nr:gamma-glutamylcyclotransferase [Paracoccaceae bacterium]
MSRLFVYGTLRDDDLLSVVVGRPRETIRTEPAVLPDHQVQKVKGEGYPMIRVMAGASAEGLLISELSAADLARLDYYEGAHLYDRITVSLKTASGMVEAGLYMPTIIGGLQPDGDWSLTAFQVAEEGISVEAAREFMDYMVSHSATEALKHYPMMRVRAQSRLAAREALPPHDLRRGFGDDDVVTEALRRPYLGYFAVEERDLKFRKFGGEFSETVTRAVFLSPDSVTLLPYDPARDEVLLIEQFRAGPLMRGDPRPWRLEPVAGRRDPHESYADTAMRESLEEAGLELRALEEVGRYYPSPGAFTEYMVSYVGIADLAGRAESVHGLASEAEDIRTIIVSFDAAMAAVASGEIDVGPLLITLYWLAQNRDRLRVAHSGA